MVVGTLGGMGQRRGQALYCRYLSRRVCDPAHLLYVRDHQDSISHLGCWSRCDVISNVLKSSRVSLITRVWWASCICYTDYIEFAHRAGPQILSTLSFVRQGLALASSIRIPISPPRSASGGTSTHLLVASLVPATLSFTVPLRPTQPTTPVDRLVDTPTSTSVASHPAAGSQPKPTPGSAAYIDPAIFTPAAKNIATTPTDMRITTADAPTFRARTANDVDMFEIKKVLPFMTESDRGLCFDAGRGMIGPDDVLRLFDEDSPFAPHNASAVFDGCDSEGPHDLLTRIKRFCDFCRDMRVWARVCSHWRRVVNIVHDDPLDLLNAIEILEWWTMDMQRTHKWASIMECTYRILDRLDQAGPITAEALFQVDGLAFSDIRERCLGADSLVSLPPPNFETPTTPHDSACLAWNLRLNGCTRGAECKQRVKKDHICIICRSAGHRMAADENCRRKGKARGLITDPASKVTHKRKRGD